LDALGHTSHLPHLFRRDERKALSRFMFSTILKVMIPVSEYEKTFWDGL
jgi:hypothetical protein